MTTCKVFQRILLDTASILRELHEREEYYEVVGPGVTGDVSRRIDITAEDAIEDALKSTGYNVLFVSEEKGARSIGSLSPEFIVLVDPLDGSLNYVSGIPFASVSIAVYKPGSKIYTPIYAGLKNIFANELFEVCNNDIYYNNVRVEKALIRENNVVSIYTENPSHLEALLSLYRGLGRELKTRTMGAASLEAVYASLGLIDAFMHLTGKLRNFDVAVGIAIAHRLGASIYMIPDVEVIRVDSIERVKRIIITHNPILASRLPQLLE